MGEAMFAFWDNAVVYRDSTVLSACD